jgi:hypothetical protein
MRTLSKRPSSRKGQSFDDAGMLRASPAWRLEVGRSLAKGLTVPKSGQELEAAIDEVLEARISSAQALIRPRVYAADMVQSAKSKANAIRACREVIAQLSAEPFPAAILAATRDGRLRSKPCGSTKFAMTRTIEDGRSAASDVVKFLDSLAAELESNPYPMPTDYMIAEPSFYIFTPARLKQKFVASLMVIY